MAENKNEAIKGTDKEPKQDPKQAVKRSAPAKPLAHIDDFLRVAKGDYNLTSMQVAGFKGYMQGKFYLKEEKDFVAPLEKYLGKGEK